jgi:hypothetical protein
MSTLVIRAQDQEKMNMRGDKHMGFDHLKTTHHFLLASDGGAIQVEANDAKDSASRDQIRRHLRHIAMMFSEGDFQVPMLIHERTPPGSEVMQKLKGEISYEYKETDRGALFRFPPLTRRHCKRFTSQARARELRAPRRGGAAPGENGPTQPRCVFA